MHQITRLQICTLKTFSETIRRRWYLPPDLKIGFPVFGGLIQGQIYGPRDDIINISNE